MKILDKFSVEILQSGIVFITAIFLRILVFKLVKKFAKSTQILEHRSNLVIKYIHLLINLLAIVALFFIWSLGQKDIAGTFVTVASVISVAMFAYWSILSNITAGIVLFFTFPFKIGDVIKVHDEHFPITAEVIDIGAFHVTFKSKEGEIIVYPNNVLMQKGISIMKNHFEDVEFTD